MRLVKCVLGRYGTHGLLDLSAVPPHSIERVGVTMSRGNNRSVFGQSEAVSVQLLMTAYSG